MKTLLFGLGIALAIPSVGRAGELRIDFEDLAEGTLVADQYRALGVTFDTRGWLPFSAKTSAGLAASGNTVANITCAPACSAEFATASAYGVFRGRTHRSVSVRVGAFPNQSGKPSVVTLTAYNATGAIVGKPTAASVAPGAGFRRRLVVKSAASDIAAFSIAARPNADVNNPIGIDDLTFDEAEPGQSPDFAIKASPSVLAVVAGRTASVTIEVNRLNGSTGEINLDVAGLPPGVLPSFADPSISETALTLFLQALADTPATMTPSTVTVSATPSTSMAGPAPRSVPLVLDVRRSFSILPPPSAEASVRGCATTAVPFTVRRDFTFPGPLTLRAEGLPPGVHATFSPNPVLFEGGVAEQAIVLSLTADAQIASLSSSAVRIVASGAGAPDIGFDIPVRAYPAAIASFSPSSGNAPQDLKLGDQVVLRGDGFCATSTVRFGNVWAITTADSISPGGDEIRVRVPRLATSGPITVLRTAQDTASTAQAFWVDSYRNQKGFAFANPSQIDVKFDDVSDLFGEDQTHLSIDFCWPFGCSVTTPIPSPLAAIFTAIASAALDDGQCFGVALSSQRILHGDKALSAFPPLNAASLWHLSGADRASPALLHYVHVQHIAQLSAEFLHWWLEQAALNTAQPSGHIRSQIMQALSAGDHPLVSIRNSTNGHVVVAYNIEEDGQGLGGFYIDIYDPNQPFLLSEDSSADQHRQRVGYSDPVTGDTGSRIHITTDGAWRYAAKDWGGGLDSLVVAPYTVVPVIPTMPTHLNGLVTLITGRGATTSQFGDSSGRGLLGPTGEVIREPGVIPRLSRFALLNGGSASSDILLVGGPGAYTQTLAGDGSGAAFTHATFSTDSATRLTSTAAKSVDKVEVASGKAGVGYRSTAARPYSADLVGRAPDDSECRFLLQTMSSTGGDEVAFDARRDTVTFRHAGPAQTYSFKLGWAGPQGPPQALSSGELTARPGDVITIAPRDWRKLKTQPVDVRVRKADGTVTTSVIEFPRPKGLKVTSLALGGAGSVRSLGVEAIFETAPEAGAMVFVAWNVSRDGRSVMRHVEQFTGESVRDRRLVAEWQTPMAFSGPVDVIAQVSLVQIGDWPDSDSASLTRTLAIP